MKFIVGLGFTKINYDIAVDDCMSIIIVYFFVKQNGQICFQDIYYYVKRISFTLKSELYLNIFFFKFVFE